jgi:hypothetical protein
MYYTEPKRTTPAPVYEYFTFDYFPTFKQVASTNLAQIVKMCRGGSQEPAATQEFSELSIQPLIKKKSTYPKINKHLTAQIQKWIPGVSICSSPSSLPPAWPKQTELTAFMTAVNATPNPFPTRVFYDWTRSPQAQNSTLYTYPEDPKNYAQTALLTGATGYIAFVQKDGTVTDCKQVLPGTQVPNWQEVDRCQCRAEIAPRTVLNPSNVPTKILWCKTDLAAQQVFWTWYSNTGTPIVFMQSNSSPTAGTGLNLADYYGWSPGSVAPSGMYDLPEACKKAPKVPNAYPKACNDCHMPLNLPKKNGAQ